MCKRMSGKFVTIMIGSSAEAKGVCDAPLKWDLRLNCPRPLATRNWESKREFGAANSVTRLTIIADRCLTSKYPPCALPFIAEAPCTGLLRYRMHCIVRADL